MTCNDYFIERYFDESLDELPVNIYLKDRNGVCLRANKRMSGILGFGNEPSNVIGYSDFELIPDRQSAQMCRDNDLLILAEETKQCFIERAVHFDKSEALYLSIKMPYYDRYNRVSGVFGVSFDTTDNDYIRSTSSITEIVESLTFVKTFFNKPEQKQIFNQLSSREQQCLTLLLRGKTAKESAKILKISPRTVEHYIMLIKQKCGCFSKSELFQLFL